MQKINDREVSNPKQGRQLCHLLPRLTEHFKEGAERLGSLAMKHCLLDMTKQVPYELIVACTRLGPPPFYYV